MAMKIKVIIPNSGMDRVTLDSRERMLAQAVSPGTTLCVDCIKSGPDSIESHTDEVLAGIQTLEECARAEKEGFDAVVVYCFSDLAVDAARETVRIPVIGPGETALAAADLISLRFTVATTVTENVSRTKRRLMKNKIAREKLAAVRPLDIPVVSLRQDPQLTERYLERICRAAVDEDGADTVLLGCLGMAQYGSGLEGTFGIKILDPAFLAVAYAELAARLALVPAGGLYSKYKKGKIYVKGLS